jgi:hypothetical protein
MRFRHHGRTAFLAADNVLDTGVVKPVQCGQKALPRNGEHSPYTVDLELSYQYLSAVAHLVLLAWEILEILARGREPRAYTAKLSLGLRMTIM